MSRASFVRASVLIIFVTHGWAVPVRAESRRALLVGIDKYVPNAAASTRQTVAESSSSGRPRGAWSDLAGAVNDVQEMQAILVARYGFKPEDVHVLTNADASRERILREARAWLVESAVAGDVRLFFYAGHGSQVKNSLSEEADKLDESIVPADANRGAPDLRDKELAALFDPVVEKKVHLTLIFDSCHSGSIGRGAPRIARVRFVEPDTRDVADPQRALHLEEYGALILSAAQDYQLAAEWPDERQRPHGLFSWALLKVLRTMPVNASAERMFLQVHAVMQSAQAFQEPVLASTSERRKLPLFGVGTAATNGLAVAVERIESDGSVILQGGIGAGLHKDAILRKAGDRTETGLRLRVTEAQGLTRSRAVGVDGRSTRALQAGTLFEVVRWTSAGGPALRVWVGPTDLDVEGVRRQAQVVEALSGPPGVTLMDDPTEATAPASLIAWNGSSWRFIAHDGTTAPIAGALTSAAIAPFAAKGPVTVMPTLPLPSEAALALEIGAGKKNNAIEVLPTPEHADYLLLGRIHAGTIEYAWVRPGVAAADAQASALPARTDWIALGSDGPEALAAQLRMQAMRLGVIRSWIQLDSPADSGTFPYHLALKDVTTGKLRTTGPTTQGERYDLVLAQDEGATAVSIERRFVYVFIIDSEGRSQLLFPRGTAGAVENLLPLGTQDPAPKELRLSRLTVTPPFGVDTYVMLTSATQLADPTVLEGEAVRTRGESGLRGASDPLTRLLAGTGAATRGIGADTPADWSLERLSVQSVAARSER